MHVWTALEIHWPCSVGTWAVIVLKLPLCQYSCEYSTRQAVCSQALWGPWGVTLVSRWRHLLRELVAISLVPALSSSVVLDAVTSEAEKKSLFWSPWILCKLFLGSGSSARHSCPQFCQGLWMRMNFTTPFQLRPAHKVALHTRLRCLCPSQIRRSSPLQAWSSVTLQVTCKAEARKPQRRQTKPHRGRIKAFNTRLKIQRVFGVSKISRNTENGNQTTANPCAE